MRMLNRYSIYKSMLDLSRYPTRLVGFKRPKWKRTRKKVLKYLRSVVAPINADLSKVTPTWLYAPIYNSSLVRVRLGHNKPEKNGHRHRVYLRRKLLVLLDLNKRAVRKVLSSKRQTNFDLDSRRVFQHHYSLQYLLFYNSFYKSVYHAKSAIQSRLVKVNGVTCKSNKLLKKGDLIEIMDTSIGYNAVLKKYTQLIAFNPYREIDVYSQSMVLHKGLNETGIQDSCYSVNDYLDFSNLQ